MDNAFLLRPLGIGITLISPLNSRTAATPTPSWEMALILLRQLPRIRLHNVRQGSVR